MSIVQKVIWMIDRWLCDSERHHVWVLVVVVSRATGEIVDEGYGFIEDRGRGRQKMHGRARWIYREDLGGERVVVLVNGELPLTTMSE